MVFLVVGLGVVVGLFVTLPALDMDSNSPWLGAETGWKVVEWVGCKNICVTSRGMRNVMAADEIFIAMQ